MISAIALAYPWALLGLAGLPAIWWLLRVTPPPPQRLSFPALALLADLTRREQTPTHTPLWLLALRLILAAALILALAGPTLNPQATGPLTGPLILVIDDTYAAAVDWPDRLAYVDSRLASAERANRLVTLVLTATSEDAPPFLARPAADIRAQVRALAPKPWGADRALAAKRLGTIDHAPGGEVLWITDGIDDSGSAKLVAALSAIGPISLYFGIEPDPLALSLTDAAGRLAARIVRTDPAHERQVKVKLIGDGGLVLKLQDIDLPAGRQPEPAVLDLPIDLANRVQRIELDTGLGGPSAGHVALADERNRRRPVALISGEAFESAQWLLSDLFYLERALSPYADISTVNLEAALDRKPALIVLADLGLISGESAKRLQQYIADGGVVLRFAGAKLAADTGARDLAAPNGGINPEASAQTGTDPLLPVQLRQGDRSLGGALTWERPARIAAFDADSPFAGLAVPDDITVSRQVLAEPTNDPSVKIWARLDDGTPLITARRQGQGWLILSHVTATPEWSNLALSGLYVDMLRRVLGMTRAVGGDSGAADLTGALKAVSSLNGFGTLGPALASAEPLDAATLSTVHTGPKHPPGYYGEDARRRALNVIQADTRLTPLVPPEGASSINARDGYEIDLAPYLYLSAFILLLADIIATLGLGGHLRRAATVAAIAALAISLGTNDSHAAASISREAAANDARLAFVRSGDGLIDSLSQAGLHGLTEVIARRTAFEPADPTGIDIERDEIVFYPLLYWPILPNTRPLSDQAAAKVNAYMKAGGLILFDTRDGGAIAGIEQPAQTRLRELLSALDVPPLARVGAEHVLTKTFYLLQGFPGRWRDGAVWAQANQTPKGPRGRRSASGLNDGVSPIIIGSQDWAAAWAVDEHGNPMAALVPDDGDQREMAYRFGVNLVMYALTGNYKSDQVHVPALLERLGQ
jgi:hypothetical protein